MEKNSDNILLLTGNDAAALGALAAGCTFFAGYPITPSSEVAEEMSRILPRIGGQFIQMEDEIASIAAIIGASLAGKKSLTATSGPGYSLMQENIGFAVMAEAPCVIVNIQRTGPSTGLPTKSAQGDLMQSRWGSHGDYRAIVVCPWSVSEMFECMIKAFNYSEIFRSPVTVLGDEIIGHMRENVVLPDIKPEDIVERLEPGVTCEEYLHFDESQPCAAGPMASYGNGWRFNVTGLTHDQEGIPTNKIEEINVCHNRLLSKIDDNLKRLEWYENYDVEDAEVLFVAYGSIARSARAAQKTLRAEGIKVGMFRPITVWPFPEHIVTPLLAKAKLIVVPEMNDGQMAGEIRKFVDTDKKIVRVNRLDGEMIPPSWIIKAVKENL